MKVRIPFSSRYLALWLFLALLAPRITWAASTAPLPSLALTWSAPAKVKDSILLHVKVTLPTGWYINSNTPLDSFLVATRLEVAAPGLEFDPPRYPAPAVEHSQVMGGNMSLFKGPFEITVTARAPKAGKKHAALPKPLPPAKVTLHFQSCDGSMCWPPKAVTAVLQDGVMPGE